MSFTFTEIIKSVYMSVLYGAFISALIAPILYIFKSALATAVSVVLYGMGFLFISYLYRDGELRLYMFLVSFASFYLSKKYVFDKLLHLIKKTEKYISKITLFGKFKGLHPLDKTEEK